MELSENLKVNIPGMTEEDCYSWKVEPPDSLKSKDGLYLKEYLKYLIRTESDDVDFIVQTPTHCNTYTWIYEHFCQICIEVNGLILLLAHECDKESCPKLVFEDKTAECYLHNEKRNCSAFECIVHMIDYIIHKLNTDDIFQSPIALQESCKPLFSEFSYRLYQVFSHAYCSHRESFERFEHMNYLFSRYTQLTTKYGLVDPDVITIGEVFF